MTLRAAILGTGNIGFDLLTKARRSRSLKVTQFVGRRADSEGIRAARLLGVPTSANGIEGLLENLDSIDVVFDATSAVDHGRHDPILRATKKELLVLDLTPAKLGDYYVPNVTTNNFSEGYCNLNLVTCGGQTSIPLIHEIAKNVGGGQIRQIELVSTLASPSAGPATRRNIDEYVDNTSKAISKICEINNKVMLVLNPAKPEIVMRSSIYIDFEHSEIPVDKIKEAINTTNAQVKKYCDGYHVAENLMRLSDSRVKLLINVESTSDNFPKYAGNLDIINTAAIQAAEAYDYVKS
jgi:acetaldehyde dehydrogenase (acetylating)